MFIQFNATDNRDPPKEHNWIWIENTEHGTSTIYQTSLWGMDNTKRKSGQTYCRISQDPRSEKTYKVYVLLRTTSTTKYTGVRTLHSHRDDKDPTNTFKMIKLLAPMGTDHLVQNVSVFFHRRHYPGPLDERHTRNLRDRGKENPARIQTCS